MLVESSNVRFHSRSFTYVEDTFCFLYAYALFTLDIIGNYVNRGSCFYPCLTLYTAEIFFGISDVLIAFCEMILSDHSMEPRS